MKTSIIKRTLIMLFALVAALSFSLVLTATGKAQAAPSQEDFYIEAGASVRIADDCSGIRYKVYISEAYYQTVDDGKVYVEIDKANNADKDEALKYEFDETNIGSPVDGKYELTAAVTYENTTVPEKAYPTELDVIAYVNVSGAKQEAYKTDNVRSMRGVAIEAAINGEEGLEKYFGGNAVEQLGNGQGGGMYYTESEYGAATIMSEEPSEITEVYVNGAKVDFHSYIMEEMRASIVWYDKLPVKDGNNHIALVTENGSVIYSDIVVMKKPTPAPGFGAEANVDVNLKEHTGDTVSCVLPMGMPKEFVREILKSDGTKIEATFSDASFDIPKDVLARGENEIICRTYSADMIYSVYVADLIIDEWADFEEYDAHFATYNKTNVVVALGRDFDFDTDPALTVKSLGSSTATPRNTQAIFTFDGRGHYIKGLTVWMGLVGMNFVGTVKNLAMIDCIVPSDRGVDGLICSNLLNTGKIENCYISGTKITGTAKDKAQGGVIRCLGLNSGGNMSQPGGTISNCLVAMENISADFAPAPSLLTCGSVYDDHKCYGGKVENVFGISSTLTNVINQGEKNPVPTEQINNKIYKSAAELMSEGLAVETLVKDNTPWNIKEDGLYFGDLLVAQFAA